ncbi:MAG: response regulator [Candidatus Paceibacterota bacterium]|jgi:two-component system response regulator YesN
MKKVLVADDDESIRKLIVGLLKTILKKENLVVVEAEDGFEAKEKFSKEFDLVILDYRMPKIDGFKLAKFIRETSEATKIIMITGSFFGHEFPADLKVDDFIIKPFRVKDFTTTVSKLLI